MQVGSHKAGLGSEQHSTIEEPYGAKPFYQQAKFTKKYIPPGGV
jgi:hypothetical protein